MFLNTLPQQVCANNLLLYMSCFQLQEVKVFSPDYDKVDKEKAYHDFKERIKHYEEAYETLSLEYEGYVTLISDLICQRSAARALLC